METLTTWAGKALTLLLVFIAPVQATLVAVSGLVMADLMTGIWAAFKEKQEITSYKLRRTVAKTIAYQAGIIIAHVLETYILSGVPVTKTVSALIGMTEAKSVFENLHRITGIDFWSAILNKLHGGTLEKRNEK